MPTPTDPQPAQPWEQARHAAASGPAGVPAETPVVDTDGVVEAAHAATAHKLGNSVRGHLVVDTAVRVDLTSWPRARETATFLTELGYQVSGPEPAPDSSGWSVTVAGWDTERLQSRACALEQAVRDLGARHGDVAGEAVTRFQAYLRQGMNQNTAHQQATADMPFAPQTPPGLGPPVSERDLALGPPEHQEPLVRIAAAQATWRNLATTNVARQAIGLYLTFTQAFGHPADRAHAQVVAEAVQGVRSEHDTVLFHLRERLSTDRHPETTASVAPPHPLPAYERNAQRSTHRPPAALTPATRAYRRRHHPPLPRPAVADDLDEASYGAVRLIRNVTELPRTFRSTNAARYGSSCSMHTSASCCATPTIWTTPTSVPGGSCPAAASIPARRIWTRRFGSCAKRPASTQQPTR